MGRTRDPRFLRSLERMGTDLYAVARRNAVAAIARIREAEEAAARLPGLELSVLGVEKMPNGGRHLWMRIQEAGGGFVCGLAPTNIMLWKDGELVVDYQLAEERASACIGVGFALCGDSGISSSWLEAAGQAAARCLQYRRAADPRGCFETDLRGPAGAVRLEPGGCGYRKGRSSGAAAVSDGWGGAQTGDRRGGHPDRFWSHGVASGADSAVGSGHGAGAAAPDHAGGWGCSTGTR